MTHEAKMVISDILIVAQARLAGTRKPFNVLGEMLFAYFQEWNWV